MFFLRIDFLVLSGTISSYDPGGIFTQPHVPYIGKTIKLTIKELCMIHDFNADHIICAYKSEKVSSQFTSLFGMLCSGCLQYKTCNIPWTCRHVQAQGYDCWFTPHIALLTQPSVPSEGSYVPHNFGSTCMNLRRNNSIYDIVCEITT